MASHSIDVTAATFDELVIRQSQRLPVLVDFWAPWCAPCRTLKPVLEKLAEEYAGRFVLAKLNSDENGAIAAQYGVRGIPNVKAFVGGRVADEFAGALPESAVREFIERVLPSPAEELLLQAAQTRAGGDAGGALRLLDEAAALEPGNDRVKLERAWALLDAGRSDDAREALRGLNPLVESEPEVRELRARIDFSGGAASAGDAAGLERRIAADPSDLEARLQLARLRVAGQSYEEALEQLLEIVRRDRGFGDDAGRKTMLSVFSLLGNEGALVSRYRKLLAAALN